MDCRKGEVRMRQPCMICKNNKSECIECVEQLALERNKLRETATYFERRLWEETNKVGHRNMQIRNLKIEIKKLKEGNGVVGVILENHPATVFECIHNTFIEHYPKTSAEHQAISYYCSKIQELLK